MKIFWIDGLAVAQGRPKFARIGKGVRAYDPGKSREWKEAVRWQVRAGGAITPCSGAVSLSLAFYLARPKTLPKKTTYHVKRPDVDNLAKAILDALKGLAWHDDSQIVSLTVRKYYTEGTAGAGVRIVIEELSVGNAL